MNSKIETLIKKMQEENMDEAIVSSFYNMVYFTGIAINMYERLFVLIVHKEGKPTLIMNELHTAKESEDYDVVYYNDCQDSVKVVAQYLKGKTIGIDEEFRSGFLLRLMDAYPAKYVQVSPTIAKIRSIKTGEEKENMIRASQDNDKVMGEIIKQIKVGVKEIDIYNELLRLFEEYTHEPVSFTPIVSFGANCADPHHESDGTILKEGDTVVLDIGSKYHGYCSDMTRTLLGKNNPELEKVYEIVREANETAEKMIKPGVKFKDIDKTARDIIEKAGYGKYFTHRLGHGIGLVDHEPYDVSSVDEVVVEEGMCFSIEPGIYLPGKGGVRIEDLVCVEKDKALVLNNYTKDKIFY